MEDGNLGRFEKVVSQYPIDKLTVKSGNKAYVKWADFGEIDGKYFVKFRLSKDISNYVAWTCPDGDSNGNSV